MTAAAKLQLQQYRALKLGEFPLESMAVVVLCRSYPNAYVHAP